MSADVADNDIRDDEERFAVERLQRTFQDLTENQREILVTTIRNPDASTRQIARHVGKDDPDHGGAATAGRVIRDYLMGIAGDEDGAYPAEVRDGNRMAESWDELTPKQQAILDYMARQNIREFGDRGTRGDETAYGVAEKISTSSDYDVAVSRTYVHKVVENYGHMIDGRRGQLIAKGTIAEKSGGDRIAENEHGWIRPAFERAGIAIPDDNLDISMTDTDDTTEADLDEIYEQTGPWQGDPPADVDRTRYTAPYTCPECGTDGHEDDCSGCGADKRFRWARAFGINADDLGEFDTEELREMQDQIDDPFGHAPLSEEEYEWQLDRAKADENGEEPPEKPWTFETDTGETEAASTNPVGEGRIEGVYECWECGEVFDTAQGLGGHRSAGCPEANDADTDAEDRTPWTWNTVTDEDLAAVRETAHTALDQVETALERIEELADREDGRETPETPPEVEERIDTLETRLVDVTDDVATLTDRYDRIVSHMDEQFETIHDSIESRPTSAEIADLRDHVAEVETAVERLRQADADDAHTWTARDVAEAFEDRYSHVAQYANHDVESLAAELAELAGDGLIRLGPSGDDTDRSIDDPDIAAAVAFLERRDDTDYTVRELATSDKYDEDLDRYVATLSVEMVQSDRGTDE